MLTQPTTDDFDDLQRFIDRRREVVDVLAELSGAIGA